MQILFLEHHLLISDIGVILDMEWKSISLFVLTINNFHRKITFDNSQIIKEIELKINRSSSH